MPTKSSIALESPQAIKINHAKAQCTNDVKIRRNADKIAKETEP